MKTKPKCPVVVQITYIDNPKQAEAAMAVLRRGLRRALVQLATEKSAKNGVA